MKCAKCGWSTGSNPHSPYACDCIPTDGERAKDIMRGVESAKPIVEALNESLAHADQPEHPEDEARDYRERWLAAEARVRELEDEIGTEHYPIEIVDALRAQVERLEGQLTELRRVALKAEADSQAEIDRLEKANEMLGIAAVTVIDKYAPPEPLADEWAVLHERARKALEEKP